MIEAAESREQANEGVFTWARSMSRALQEYIESSYHLRDEGLIAERKALLETPGVIFQEPYIEATPTYKAARKFSDLSIDTDVRNLLEAAGCEDGVSIYDPPYTHQADALEAVLKNDADLIVSTGTGSGKTETFLLPIISSLYLEGLRKPSLCKIAGARAIVLYPMNALVNDQLFRLRRLLYKSELADRLKEARGRRVRFAAYTGRMPYPGRREAAKDTRYIAPLFDEFYLPLLRKGEKLQLLESGGRWPAKDLESFYGADLRQSVVRHRRGVEIEGNAYNWDKRLITQPDDAELFARHEVLKACPDILITNYSMLEYMLIRPIERGIFEQTRQWLHSDPDNRLTFVIDEAHLYRGAAGAEIAMLIRRLMARLEASRDQIRCIITSASIGDGATGVRDARRFAEELTGKPTKREFHFVGSTLDLPESRGVLVRKDQQTLAASDVGAIRQAVMDGTSSDSCGAIVALAYALGWPSPSSGEPPAEYLFDKLLSWPPVGTLVDQVSRAGMSSSELIRLVAGLEDNVSSAAVAALLELCSLAKKGDRVLLPARMHLFFRGLPGIWACVNPDCDARRSTNDVRYALGKFFDSPRAACDCGMHARVFELLSHRGCGAAFIQAYVDSQDGEFLWSEGGELPDDISRKLVRIELLVDGEPHPDFPSSSYERAYLDVVSGKLIRHAESAAEGQRSVVLPSGPNKAGDLAFSACPVCQVRWRESAEGHSQIERHNTRGENPFVAVLREQLEKQPAAKMRHDQLQEVERYPNRGRKALVFSDGRQRAARLARVVPDVIEQDAFRQALCRAVALRAPDTLEARLDSKLYSCFVKACSENNVAMFSENSRLTLRQQMRDRSTWDLEDILDEPLEERAIGYSKKLYWALSDPYYSLHVLGIGYLVPAKQVWRRIIEEAAKLDSGFISENIEPLAAMWIRAALREYVFDKNIDTFYRQVVSHTPKAVFGSDGKTAPTLREALLKADAITEADLESLESIFTAHLTEKASGENLFLKPDALALRVAVDASWYRCAACLACHPVAINGRCAECFWPDAEKVAPNSAYMMSRKDLWRRPIRRTIAGQERLATFLAAEHTAQLSHRDRAAAHATTELHELRFQDILIREDDEPIDVLSCTTTMEVGIDIGSLVAVAMRNIPPERSNYQQRAGRAGRRGSGLSTVLAFAELMPHDAYYFANPDKIVRGTPRTPEIKVSNPKIAKRHVNAFVFQRFFSDLIDRGIDALLNVKGLYESFGSTEKFFHVADYAAGLNEFKRWMNRELHAGKLVPEIIAWLPRLDTDLEPKEWIEATCRNLLDSLEGFKERVPLPQLDREDGDDDDVEEVASATRKVPRNLLDFLADSGLLPTYALPRHVASFLIEDYRLRNGYQQVRVKEMPQQELRKALSEYAPGRIVTVNGVDYRSGAVTASAAFGEKDRAKRLFDESQHLLTCSVCDFVRIVAGSGADVCPICNSALGAVEMIEPEVFMPDDMDGVPENDRAQERTYATGAQLPLPADEDRLPDFERLGYGVSFTYAKSQELITLNRGPVRAQQNAGFWVCELCGQTELDTPKGRHTRPYLVEGPTGRTTSCRGRHRNVFLGQIFRTDLLVLRVALKSPVINDIANGFERHLLHSAFETISQALTIAASRHRDLDVDSQEFGSGYRFLPNADDTVSADIYLYDTLEGGAGFAEIASTRADEIVADMIHLLESCPADCARSCTRCLRHFKNQHVTSRLDRRLAALLLRYAMQGPAGLEHIDTPQQLWAPLTRLLQTDGLAVEPVEHGIRVRGHGKQVDVFGYKPILQERVGADFVSRRYGNSALAVNEISLLLDPPNVHAAIRARI